MLRSKCLNDFWSRIFISSSGSPLYEEYVGMICHSSLYLAILTYINELLVSEFILFLLAVCVYIYI